MELPALALVLAAACMHAAWNTLTKRARDPFLFFWMSMVLACVWALPAALYLGVGESFGGPAWIYIAISGVIHALYFASFTRGYAVGNLSLVYPVSRGLGVGLVPVGAWFWLGESVTPLALAGIAVVVVGIVVVGSARGGSGRAGLGWAILTGFLIGSYALVDRAGINHVHPIPFIVLSAILSVALLAPWTLWRRAELATEWADNRGTILTASLLNLSGYILVLWAFSFGKTAHIVASRELSIVISTVVGVRLLGEGHGTRRLTGAALIMLGVGILTAAP